MLVVMPPHPQQVKEGPVSSEQNSNCIVTDQYTVIRGGSRANLKEGQLVMEALTNFQKLVTRVLIYNNLRSIFGINSITLR